MKNKSATRKMQKNRPRKNCNWSDLPKKKQADQPSAAEEDVQKPNALLMKKATADQKTQSNNNIGKNHSLSDLPDVLLRLVRERLPSYRDIVRFRGVCISWHNAFVRDDDLQQQRAIFLLQGIDCSPVLNPPHKRDEVICEASFFDLLSEERFTITTVVRKPNMKRDIDLVFDVGFSCFCCSNSDGWLLLLIKSDRWWWESRFLIRNPVRDETVQLKLPKINWKSSSRHKRRVKLAAFSTINPTSLDCVIFVLWEFFCDQQQYFTITTYSQKDRRWSCICELPSCGPDGETWEFLDVAYLEGKFYCAINLSSISSVVLGTFDVALGDWVVMDSSSYGHGYGYGYGNRYSNLPRNVNLEIYLVESDGKLLLALGHNKVLSIYRFDLQQKNWTRVENLGNRMLILHRCETKHKYYIRSSSFATQAVGAARRFGNRVIQIYGDHASHFCEIGGEWHLHKHSEDDWYKEHDRQCRIGRRVPREIFGRNINWGCLVSQSPSIEL